MIRNLRDLLSLVCLPLLLAIVLMWGRSYFVLDRLTYRSADNQDCHLRSDSGRVTWFWTTPLFPQRHVLPQLTAHDLPMGDRLIEIWDSLGFYHEFQQKPADAISPTVARSLTMIPYWFLFLVTGAAPMWRGAAFGRTVALKCHRRWKSFTSF